MPAERPTVIVLGGVNGAGKTTSSRRLLAEQLVVTSFVNADEIARGLCAFAPGTVAIAAGRILLQRLEELARERVGFAFETTLAGRTYLPFLQELKGLSYVIEIHYFWLRSADLAVERVRKRVLSGGHDIPEPTIRQRYERSIRNFWTKYRGMADAWYVYDNSGPMPDLFAAGNGFGAAEVGNAEAWTHFQRGTVDA
jgi:predicted ABC-type ATPase